MTAHARQLGAVLRSRRKALGLTQLEVAQLVRCTREAISRIETDSSPMLWAAARAYTLVIDGLEQKQASLPTPAPDPPGVIRTVPVPDALGTCDVCGADMRPVRRHEMACHGGACGCSVVGVCTACLEASPPSMVRSGGFVVRTIGEDAKRARALRAGRATADKTRVGKPGGRPRKGKG